MKSALRSLKSLSSLAQSSSPGTRFLPRLYSALPHSENDEQEPSFDSSNFTLPVTNPETKPPAATWDESLRKKANWVVSGIENSGLETKISGNEEKPTSILPDTNFETTGQTVKWDGSLRRKANGVASGIENRGLDIEVLENEEKPSFDSADFTLPNQNAGTTARKETWDEKLREKADRVVGGRENRGRDTRVVEKEEEKRRKAAMLARALLEAALDRPDEEGEEEEEEEEEGVVTEEDQMSLNVGIIGAPNAGKSALTNFMVGTKVAAVSRKTNTTTHEVLGVMTSGTTQICFFDTPGIMLKKSGFPSADMKFRVKSAWSSVNLYDVLIVIFDVHRHLKWPDSRVVKLIERMGAEVNPKQKRVLCMNKVDLVEKKKDLLQVAEQFKDLPGYDRYFMISGLKGSGVKDLSQFLMEQAVKRPWDEDPFVMSEEVMKNISLEVVRERMLDHIHQEIPYNVEHRLVDWKELADGSLRIEQHLITPKMSQRKILIGKNGSKIGRIGIEANEELRSIFKINVHLILMVRVK